MRSCHKFPPSPRAELLGHVQICDLIGSLDSKLVRRNVLKVLTYELMNCQWNGLLDVVTCTGISNVLSFFWRFEACIDVISMIAGEHADCGPEVGCREGTSLEAADASPACQLGVVRAHSGPLVGHWLAEERGECAWHLSCGSGREGPRGVPQTGRYKRSFSTPHPRWTTWFLIYCIISKFINVICTVAKDFIIWNSIVVSGKIQSSLRPCTVINPVLLTYKRLLSIQGLHWKDAVLREKESPL